MKFKQFILALVVVFAVASCEKSNDNNTSANIPNTSTNATDQNFTANASMANTAEVQAGQLAATKATDPDVKSFGQFMVSEHTMSQMQLDSAVMYINLQTSDSLNAQATALMAQLNSLSGREFDSAYIHSQVTAHQVSMALFRMEADSGYYYRLRNYANATIPHLQTHLSMAQTIAARY